MKELNNRQKEILHSFEEFYKNFDWDAEHDAIKKEEGAYERSLEIAKQMIKRRFSQKDTIDITGINEEEYKELLMPELSDGEKTMFHIMEEMDKAFDWDAEYERRKEAIGAYKEKMDIAKKLIKENFSKKDVLKYTGIDNVDYNDLIGIE